MAWGPISIAGSASGYTLPTATKDVLGGVKTGKNITNTNGIISLSKENVTAALGYTPPTADSMTAATTSAAGKAGLVPAPAAGKQAQFLRGDGTWAAPANTTYSAMKGATASAAGTAGLVPAPAAGAQGKFLRGDGTWQTMTVPDKLDAFPVGIVIAMVESTSPAALFGGTWEEIASDRVLMGASDTHTAGTTVEAGLPNITGTFGTRSSSPTGAFYQDSVRSDLASGNYRDTVTCHFDASRSNAIYGNSTTVQPAAFYVHYWQRKA